MVGGGDLGNGGHDLATRITNAERPFSRLDRADTTSRDTVRFGDALDIVRRIGRHDDATLRLTEKQRALWLDAEGEAEIRRVQCMPGYLMADDLARMALFLASDDSRMCTGQDFIVDGGWV